MDRDVAIDADGTYLGKCRKTHIPHVAGFWEKFFFKPGASGYPVFNTAYCKLGVYICYDRHFPEGWRALALNGAEYIVNPSATVAGVSEYLWRLEQPASAAANGVYIGAINRVGTEAPWNIGEFYGQSYFVDPRGQFLAEGSRDQDEIVIAEMDLDLIEEVKGENEKDVWMAALAGLGELGAAHDRHGAMVDRVGATRGAVHAAVEHVVVRVLALFLDVVGLVRVVDQAVTVRVEREQDRLRAGAVAQRRDVERGAVGRNAGPAHGRDEGTRLAGAIRVLQGHQVGIERQLVGAGPDEVLLTAGEIDLVVAYSGVPTVYRDRIIIGANFFGPGEVHIGPQLTDAFLESRRIMQLLDFVEGRNSVWRVPFREERTGIDR